VLTVIGQYVGGGVKKGTRYPLLRNVQIKSIGGSFDVWHAPTNIQTITAIKIEFTEMREFSNFEEVCRDWATDWAIYGLGTACDWIELHGDAKSHPELKDYQQYKVTAKVLGTTYDHLKEFGRPDYIYYQKFQNKTNADQSHMFTRTETTEASFTWSLTEGIEVGISVKGSVGLPFISNAVTAHTTIDFSATQTNTETVTQEWSIQQEVKIPAQKQVDTVLTIYDKGFNATFTTNIEIGGWFAVHTTAPVEYKNTGKKQLFFFPVTQALQNGTPYGYSVKGDKVIFSAYGVWTGVQGIGSEVTITETPMYAGPIPPHKLHAAKVRVPPRASKSKS